MCLVEQPTSRHHRNPGLAPLETAALYGVAAEYGKQALAVLTVSDHLLDHSGDMSAAERETRFASSLSLAVAAAHS